MSTEPNPSLDISNDQVNNSFEAHVGGKTAFLVYRRMPGKLVRVHTEVPIAFAGHGTGSKLVRPGIEYARGRGSRCFRCARSPLTTLRRHQEYGDLVHPDYRTRLTEGA